MTPREEKFVHAVNSVARELKAPDTSFFCELMGNKLLRAIKEFCGAEPTPVEKAQNTSKVADVDFVDGSEEKDRRDDREIARERWEDTRR